MRGRIGKALKPAVDAAGPDRVLYGLWRYLEQHQGDEPRFVTPNGYARAWRQYAEDVPQDEIDRHLELFRRKAEQRQRDTEEQRRRDAALLRGDDA
jgi:hypothetical protein